MTDSNISKAVEHRLIPSMFSDGSFPMAWIGDTPTLDARREYIRAYLEWRLPHGDMENQERKLRDLAERKAAMWLINDNVIEISTEQFEWLVDEMFWYIWLFYQAVIHEIFRAKSFIGDQYIKPLSKSIRASVITPRPWSPCKETE